MIISKKCDPLPSDNDGRLGSSNVIDPVRYVFKVILMSSDALFLVYLAWASQQLSNLNLPYLVNMDIFKSLSLLWVLRFIWGLCYDKLSFTLIGNYYRLKYGLSLLKYYITSFANSLVLFIRQRKFKLHFDPAEYPIDTHVYEGRRKSQMIILSHLLSLFGLQVITIAHWIIPFDLKLNENLQFIKFIGIILVGFSIVGQSSASDVRLYCDVKESSIDKQTVYLCEALTFKALFGFIAQVILFKGKLHLFPYIVITKSLIAISVLFFREDISKSLQIRYMSNKRVDNFEILVPCLWFFIILHSGIDSRWYFQRFGMRNFPLSNLFDVLATLSNQLAKVSISIFIGLYIKFTAFPKLFPFSIAICIILKLIGLIILKFNIDPIYTLSLVLLETICSSFVQQAVLIFILMICISAPTRIPIALMSLPAICMQYSTILRYSSSIWNSILSSQSSLIMIQAISISIYIAALVTCWNIKFDKITTKTQDVHKAYIRKISRESVNKSSYDAEDDRFWGSDEN